MHHYATPLNVSLVFKRRQSRILAETMEYPFETQVRLVIALCCIHNIIRMVSGDDIYNDLWRRENSTDLNGRVDNGDVNFKAITPAQRGRRSLS